VKGYIVSNNVTKDIRIGLVIMASGLGRRFGGNKLMENLGDKPLIKWIMDSTEGLFDRRIVVTRSEDVKALCDSLSIQCILHALPNRNDTVRLGLSEIKEEIDYCFFVPGDQPLISKESITKLIMAVSNNEDNNDMIVRTSYGDTACSPMGFHKKYFNELLELPEGKGGNWIAKNYPEKVCAVDVQNEYELWDIDTVADLERVKNVISRYA